MSGKYNLKYHVLESKSEYCTADYGTRELSYSTLSMTQVTLAVQLL